MATERTTLTDIIHDTTFEFILVFAGFLGGYFIGYNNNQASPNSVYVKELNEEYMPDFVIQAHTGKYLVYNQKEDGTYKKIYELKNIKELKGIEARLEELRE